MKRRTFICLALFLSLLFVGCAKTAKPPAEPPPPSIAVVDWNAVWRVHPLAGEQEQTKKDRQAAERAFELKAELLARQQAFSSQSGKLLAAGQHGYFDVAFRTRMAELEAKNRESLLVWEQAERGKLERAWEQARSDIEARHQPELINLQLKLAVLHLPATDRQRLEEIHARTLQRRDQELLEARRGLERQFNENRAAEQARLAAQANAESEKIMQALRVEEQKKLQADAASDKQVAAELSKNQGELLAHIHELQRQETRLAEQIENDIRSETERLAVERKIGVVFRQAIANVKAVDLTSDLIRAVQQRQAK